MVLHSESQKIYLKKKIHSAINGNIYVIHYLLAKKLHVLCIYLMFLWLYDIIIQLFLSIIGIIYFICVCLSTFINFIFKLLVISMSMTFCIYIHVKCFYTRILCCMSAGGFASWHVRFILGSWDKNYDFKRTSIK